MPKTRKVIEYKEERKIEQIPKEVTVTDYYAVEYLREYIPQYVPEKRIEYVQVPKKQIRYEYIPVERQIVHYPDTALEAERTSTVVTGTTQNWQAVNPAATVSSNKVIQGGAVTSTTYPATQTVYTTQAAPVYATNTVYETGAPRTSYAVSGVQPVYATGSTAGGQTVYTTTVSPGSQSYYTTASNAAQQVYSTSTRGGVYNTGTQGYYTSSNTGPTTTTTEYVYTNQPVASTTQYYETVEQPVNSTYDQANYDYGYSNGAQY